MEPFSQKDNVLSLDGKFWSRKRGKGKYTTYGQTNQNERFEKTFLMGIKENQQSNKTKYEKTIQSPPEAEHDKNEDKLLKKDVIIAVRATVKISKGKF